MKLYIFILYHWFLLYINAWRFLPVSKKYKRMNPNILRKKYISITPGGLGGFYTMGVASYIKEKYDLKNYSYLGASAGAWNALLMCYNENPREIMNRIFKDKLLKNITSISMLQYKLRDFLIDNYKDHDFDFSKLNICISELSNQRLKSNIIDNIGGLEMAIDCCIVSSHIPYITSDNIIQKFNETRIGFDGGIFKFPPQNIYNHFIIYPFMFNDENINLYFYNLLHYSNNISSLIELYETGYKDSIQNKEYLDYIFNPNNKYLNLKDNNLEFIPFPPFSPL